MSNMVQQQMDLMGYFGFPSDGHPDPSLSSRAKFAGKKGKRQTGASTATVSNDRKNLVNDRRSFLGEDTSHPVVNDGKPHDTLEQEEQQLDEPSSKRSRVSDELDQPESQNRVKDPDDNSVSCKELGRRIFTSEEMHKQRMEQREIERRKRNRSTSTIHSILYGQPQFNSKHSTRLLQGKGHVNILSQLFIRSIRSPKTHHMASYIQSGQHWNTCQTVQLDSDRSNGEVSSMSFDKEGVLLAIGDDGGYVRIYDFDDVSALDVRKRNEWSHVSARNEKTPKVELQEEENDVQAEQKDVHLPIDPASSKPILSFRCSSYRITDLQWNPNNQDQLAVSFAQSPEIHLYDVASSKTPLPRITISGSNNSSSKGREGISVMRFVGASTTKKKPTHLLTGGSRGTIRLWSIPGIKRGQAMKDVNVRCVWSVDMSDTSGAGCSDILVLPSANKAFSDKPLVLLTGTTGSLVLLDTAKCTRKSFSTTATPTIQSSWDLYNLTARELAKFDNNMNLPARRWMGVNRMSLLGYHCTEGSVSYRLSLVLNCGWVLCANLIVSSNRIPMNSITEVIQNHNYSSSIRLQIVHQTPRIECFNSSNEKVTILGGMALNCSLPDIPIPSTAPINSLKQLIWLGDVKPKKYTMPSKDKYVLCEQHGTITSNAASSEERDDRHAGEGLILLDVTSDMNKTMRFGSQWPLTGDNSKNQPNVEESDVNRTLVRLPLSRGSPLSLAMHPSGEWIVVGYGLNGKRFGLKTLELVCMRKHLS